MRHPLLLQQQPQPQPPPQPLTSTSILSVINLMTRKKTKATTVTAGNIQSYGKRACETIKSDNKDYLSMWSLE